MEGTLFNVLSVLVGSSIGLFVRFLLARRPAKLQATDVHIGERIADRVMRAMALAVLMVGITGLVDYIPDENGNPVNQINALVVILSMAFGAAVGELLDLDRWLNRFGEWIQSKVKSKNGKTSVAEGFITASLLFCVGAMATVGSLESGLRGNHEMIYTKSVLDFISSIMFSISLGVGVILSSVVVLVYQGAIVLAASALAPILTDYTVAHMTSVGSLLIIALSLNLLGLTKIKVANLLPAVFFPLLFCLFF